MHLSLTDQLRRIPDSNSRAHAVRVCRGALLDTLMAENERADTKDLLRRNITADIILRTISHLNENFPEADDLMPVDTESYEVA